MRGSDGRLTCGEGITMKIDRLLGIVIHLLNRDRVSARALADRFEVSVRTIQRDMEALANAGIPIVAAQGSTGGYEIMEGYKLDRQVMKDEDYSLIITALRGLGSAYDHGTVEQTLDKLLSLTPQRGETQGFTAEHLFIDFGAFRESGHVQNHLAAIEKAIDAECVLEFDYTDIRNRRTHRAVEPVAIVLKWYAWYLLAYCQIRRDYRVFRLARIRDLQLTERLVSMKHPAPSEIYRTFGEEDSRPAIRLKVRGQPEIRVSLEDYFPKGNVEMNPDGTFVMQVDLMEDEPFWMGAILSYGDRVEVLEPDWVKQGIIERVRGMLALYEARS